MVHRAPLCVSRVPPFLVQLDSQTTMIPRPLTTAQGSFSDCSGIVGPLSVCISLHTHFEDHLRQHLLQRVMVNITQGMFQLREINQMEFGKGGVPVPRVGAQC